MRFTIGHFTIPIVAFFFFFFTYSKIFFFFPQEKKIKIRFKKERFTIGIVKLPIVKRSVPFKRLSRRRSSIRKRIRELQR